MLNRFFVDEKDAFDKWKISVMDGGYNQFVCLPPMKDVETNDWNEIDGIEADLSSPTAGGRTFTMSFICTGTYIDVHKFIEYLRINGIDADGSNSGIYHILKSNDIGGLCVTARFINVGNVSFGNMHPPFIFPVTFADDSGFIYDSSIPSPDTDSNGTPSIDEIPFLSFKIKLLDGTINNIYSGISVKEGLSVNIPDTNGVIYDINAYHKLKSGNISLKCHMKDGMKSVNSLLQSYKSFENLLFKPSVRTIKLSSDIAFECYYVGCSVTNFFPADAWLDFDLTFKVLCWV